MDVQQSHRNAPPHVGDIIDDCNVTGRLQDAVVNRLRAIQGMLMEEMSKRRQTDSEVDLLTAELAFRSVKIVSE
jgi:hypothetical protein